MFRERPWGYSWEMGQSTYGSFQALPCHLEWKQEDWKLLCRYRPLWSTHTHTHINIGFIVNSAENKWMDVIFNRPKVYSNPSVLTLARSSKPPLPLSHSIPPPPSLSILPPLSLPPPLLSLPPPLLSLPPSLSLSLLPPLSLLPHPLSLSSPLPAPLSPPTSLLPHLLSLPLPPSSPTPALSLPLSLSLSLAKKTNTRGLNKLCTLIYYTQKSNSL